MRKTAAFFLLCIYVLVQVVSVGWDFYKPLAHSYFLQQSRLDQAEGTKGLITINIDREKLNELKNEEGEIVIDGVLYDVEMAVSSGAMIKLLLKRDSKETNWNGHYNKIASLLHKNPSGKMATPAKTSFALLPLFYCKDAGTGICLVKYLHKTSPHLSAHFLPGPTNDLVTPPPRSC